jgi:hypothetical protein
MSRRQPSPADDTPVSILTTGLIMPGASRGLRRSAWPDTGAGYNRIMSGWADSRSSGGLEQVLSCRSASESSLAWESVKPNGILGLRVL